MCRECEFFGVRERHGLRCGSFVTLGCLDVWREATGQFFKGTAATAMLEEAWLKGVGRAWWDAATGGVFRVLVFHARAVREAVRGAAGEA